MGEPNEVTRRKAEAAMKRQEYERAVTLALERHRPADYELALAAARVYCNTADGLIAYLCKNFSD